MGAPPSLTWLHDVRIGDEKAGLKELSGLALAHDRRALWVVCDETARLFQVDLHGRLNPDATIELPDEDIEGISLDPGGSCLYAVREKGNEILQVDLGSGQVVARQRLKRMAGYAALAPLFAGSMAASKGLEGIAWDAGRDTLVVLKEGRPGILVALEPDLSSIRDHHVLSPERGFRVSGLDPDDLDFSDLCHDRQRDRFWILSEQASALFLYDWAAGRVEATLPLRHGPPGAQQPIAKGEGLAVDPEAGRLWLAGEKGSRLYTFALG
jgi:uncharacterized protein YjiK